jgi:hypothetical protein
MRQHLSVRVPFEHVTALFETVTELSVIIDFAIEDSPDGSVFVCHWLRACGRQVDNTEARMDEGCL